MKTNRHQRGLDGSLTGLMTVALLSVSAILFVSSFQAAPPRVTGTTGPPPPTLGSYPDTSIPLNTDTGIPILEVSPSAAPTATATATASATATGTATASPCPPIITQSSSLTITTGNSVSCNNGTGHTDNSYWRAFNMATFTGGARYDVTSVSFGVESANNTQPVTVRLYTNSGGAFPGGTRTQIASGTVSVSSAQNGAVVLLPLPVTVPAGTSELVMELFTPDGQAAGNLFFVGSNTAPQTGPSYVSAAACGLTTPTDLATLGFPNMHIVFNVLGGCDLFGTPSPTPTPTATATATTSSTATPTATASGTGTPCPDGILCETPTPTPGPTATATTAPATATPIPTPCGLTFSENFDGVTAPALPSGWTSTGTANVTPWATSTTFPTSGTNDAFAFPGSQGNNELVTPVIAVPSAGAILSFQNLFNFMASDAMVLEISIGGATYDDIIAAGGSFLTGGYTGVVSACCGSPIAGRMAWLGISAGSDVAPDYITTTLNLPAAANGQNIRLKWRLVTDIFPPIFSAEGVRIDSIIFTPATCPTPTPAPARPLNLSTRMLVQTGDQVGIGGFIITPSGPNGSSTGSGGGKQVLLRGIGPSLAQFGVPNPLADPVMELHGPAGFTTVTNDNWRDTQAAAIEATGLAPSNDLESAILVTLPPGAYTAIVGGQNATSGTGLVEVYDLGPATSQLANISTRAFVGTGDNVVIGGFILGGGDHAHIFIHAGGPSGVSGALTDATLELRDSSGTLLASNDDCESSIIGPPNPADACIDITLPAGAYTAIVAGPNGATGVGLVEIYNLN